MATAADFLQAEYDHAYKYADEFRERLKDELDARIEMYRLATERFQTFLKLPDTSSLPLAIFEVAFAVISTAAPILNIGKFIATANNRASNAILNSMMRGQAPKLADRVLDASTRLAPKLADKIKTGKSVVDTKDKIATAFKGTRATPMQAETSAIKGLLINKLEATDLWDRATDALLAERDARLNGEPTRLEPLMQIVKGIVGDIPFLKPTEIDELGMVYLHELLKQHVRTSRIGLVRAERSDEVSVIGWNDDQQTLIRKWFNHNSPAKRGKYFRVPVVQNPVDYLRYIGVPIVVRVSPYNYGGLR